MRKVILAMNISLDGYIEGPNGELDWVPRNDDQQWEELFRFLESVDTFFLGRVMYPGYSEYWRSVLKNPSAPPNHVRYARIAEKIRHVVFSKTLNHVDWENTQIMNDVEKGEITRMKQESGKDIVVLGGAALASSLMRRGLIDEYRIQINPVVLGGGKPLFNGLEQRLRLELLGAKTLPSGLVIVRYRPQDKN